MALIARMVAAHRLLALITSDCGTTRSPTTKTALITSGSHRLLARGDKDGTFTRDGAAVRGRLREVYGPAAGGGGHGAAGESASLLHAAAAFSPRSCCCCCCCSLLLAPCSSLVAPCSFLLPTSSVDTSVLMNTGAQPWPSCTAH